MRMNIWEGEDDPDEQDTPWWGTHWIPFAGQDGDDYFIDTGPGIWSNHLGDAPHADTAWFLGWPSLGVWLHQVAEVMEHHDQPDWGNAVTRPVIRKDGELDW
jgi:hypothetical protein